MQACAFLLAKGALVDRRSYTGQTALIASAGEGHSDAVELLLAAGADDGAHDDQQRSALACAQAGGHTACLALLVSAGLRRGALFAAAQCGDARELARLLDDAKERHNVHATRFGQSLLHVACRGPSSSDNDDNDAASTTDAEVPAAASAADAQGVTAVSSAASAGESKSAGGGPSHGSSSSGVEVSSVIEVLLARGADVNALDEDDLMPLHTAALYGTIALPLARRW